MKIQTNTGTCFQLASHLFEAVMKEDVRKVRSLMSAGADADQKLECAVRGPLARELQVTTARQLAGALSHKSILRALHTGVSENTLLGFISTQEQTQSYFAKFLVRVIHSNIFT